MTGRILAFLFLFSLSLFSAAPMRAQDAPGCGPANVKFNVKADREKLALPAADSTKAVVFFLQDDVKFESKPRPTTRFGIDGNWVGATQANSYFLVFVDPGEHHLCASWQIACPWEFRFARHPHFISLHSPARRITFEQRTSADPAIPRHPSPK